MAMLPKIKKDDQETKDAKAMQKALELALSPVTDEIEQLVVFMKKQQNFTATDVTKVVAQSMKRVEEAIFSISRRGQNKIVDPKTAMMMTRGLSDKNIADQINIMKDVLKNDTFRAAYTKKIVDSFTGDLYKKLVKMVETSTASTADKRKTEIELLNIFKNRDRREEAVRDASKVIGKPLLEEGSGERSLLAKLTDILGHNDKSFIAGITEGISKLAFAIGAVGLISLIPKTARDFIDNYIGAFATASKLLESSWLKPLMTILEGIPILGPLTKKIPYLSVFFFGFEHLGDIIKAFVDKGVFAGVEQTLQDLYDFFVKGLVTMIGDAEDWIIHKIYGKKIADSISVADMASVVNKSMVGLITDLTNVIKSLFSSDESDFEASVSKLLWDTVDGIAKSFMALFKIDGSKFNSKDLAEQVWVKFRDTIEGFWKAYSDGLNDLHDKIAGIISDPQKILGPIKDAIESTITTIVSYFTDLMSQIADYIKTAITSKIESLKNSITGIFTGSAVEDDGFGGMVSSSDATVAPPARPRTEVIDRRVTQQTIDVQTLAARPPGTTTAPSIISTRNNRTSATFNNFAITGNMRASDRNPLGNDR